MSQAILSFIVATPAVLSNVLLLASVYRDPANRNQIWTTPVTLLVVNLSMCDLLSGIAPGYGAFYYDIAKLKGQTREKLFGVELLLNITAVVTNIVSSCTIAAMGFDRLVAVSYPLQYKARVTKAKIKVFIAVIWIYSLLFASLNLMGVSKSVFVLLYCHLHVSVPLIILPVVYWKAYSALRSHNNRVRHLADGREQMDFARRNRERKIVSAFLWILVSFYVVFTPQYIAHNVLVFCPSFKKEASFKFFLYASNKFILVNCSLNPFIYAWRIPKYKRAFKAIFSGASADQETLMAMATWKCRGWQTERRSICCRLEQLEDNLKP